MATMRAALVVLCALSCSGLSAESSTLELIETLKAVDREGRGNAAAATALAELTTHGANELPTVLAGFEGANPLAENWLRAAVETIAARAHERQEPLPTDGLLGFVLQTENHARARRLAFELLRESNPKVAAEIVPAMLHDPSAEMRRDAVARLLDEAAQQTGDEAVTTYRRALSGAVHDDQVRTIVAALEKAGVEIDLPRHFGFLTKWSLIGPFDNREGIGFAAVYPPEQKIDLEAEYEAEYPGAKGANTWQRVTTDDDYGLVDIGEQIENHKGSVFYATTTFDAVAPARVQVRLGTPNAWKLWVNGRPVFAREEYHRGMKLDQYRVPVDLVKGENRLLLKVCQNEQDDDWAQRYQFQVRLTDAAGSAVLPAGVQPVVQFEVEPVVRKLTAGIAAVQRHVAQRVEHVSVAGGDSLQFRGDDARGVTTSPLPTSLGDDAIAWKVALPGRGVSSPIVVGDRVVVTSSSGPDQDRLHVSCFAVSTGETLWERQFWATGRTQTHDSISTATPSPASDGRRIFVFYSSNDMACLDLAGNLLWYRGIGHDFPNASNSLGMSSSPIVVDGTLVTMVESDAEAFTVGLNVETGEPKWRIDRPRKANWSSPAVLRTDAGALALVGGSKGLIAIEPNSGKVAWTYENGASTVASSTATDGLVFVPSNGLTVLEPPPRENDLGVAVKTPRVVWNDGKLAPSTGSPVVAEGRVYVVNRGSVLSAADARTGEIAWRSRLEGKGSASATPIVSNGHLYLVDKDGLLQVVRLGESEAEVIAQLDLAATIQCTPAAADGGLFIRSDEHLWRIGR